MAYEEVKGNGGGSFEEREFVSAKIGAEFEGSFVGMGPLTEGQYGSYRVVSFDSVDGRKLAVRASKILLERLEAAGLNPGDGMKVIVESETSKAGRTYALPRLFVNRSAGSAPKASAPQASAPTPALDDEPPF